MSQHDYIIDNALAPAFRSDLNAALTAAVTQNSGGTAPPTTYANMLWYDTSTDLLKMRNEANSGWITLGTVNQTNNVFTPNTGFTPVQQGGGTGMAGSKVYVGWGTASGSGLLAQVDSTPIGAIVRKVDSPSYQGDLVSPGTAPLYACRAWVNFNGTGVVAIRGSGNVTSITDNGTGIYTVNLTTPMTDVNYITNVSIMGISTDSSSVSSGWIYSGGTYSTSAVQVSTGHRIYTQSGGRDDSSVVCVALFR